MTPPEKVDRNFDELSDLFASNIYGTPKGHIRLQVLWQHLLQSLPHLQDKTPLTVLDAGCGMGQVAARLAVLGHELTLCDVSQDMLDIAREFIGDYIKQHGEAGDAAEVCFHHLALQDMPEVGQRTFDVVLCHAVLEWLAEPLLAVAALARLVSISGHLSLTFYNRDALIYRNLIRGNLRKVKSGEYAGHHGGLTPGNPLDPATVIAWLDQQGFDVQTRAGLRVFYDFIPRKDREQLSLEDILELELEYSQREPYQSLARYIHVVAVRRSTV